MANGIQSANSIEAVIKVAERCNINCSYCYVFNKGNEFYRERPVKMPREIMTATADYLAQGVADLGATVVGAVFHGGEPLMMGKRDFDYFASLLRSKLDPVTSLRLSIQTNAMLVDSEWIDLFEKHRVAAGVSIDGIKEHHDAERVDFRGRGTYERTIAGMRLLQAAARRGRIPDPGAICVIQRSASGRQTYRHFVDEVGVKGMSFHLPMDTHDTFANQDPMPYAQFVCDAFDEWLRDNDPEIDVRMFNQLLGFLQGRIGSTDGAPTHLNLQHVTIESDGVIDIDELKPTRIPSMGMNVQNSTLLEFANSKLSQYIRDVYRSLPEKCTSCVWKNYCRGGLNHGVQVNRWSDARGFDNASVLCEGLKKIYSHITHHMIRAGFGDEEIAAVLDRQSRSVIPASQLMLPTIQELATC